MEGDGRDGRMCVVCVGGLFVLMNEWCLFLYACARVWCWWCVWGGLQETFFFHILPAPPTMTHTTMLGNSLINHQPLAHSFMESMIVDPSSHGRSGWGVSKSVLRGWMDAKRICLSVCCSHASLSCAGMKIGRPPSCLDWLSVSQSVSDCTQDRQSPPTNPCVSVSVSVRACRETQGST